MHPCLLLPRHCHNAASAAKKPHKNMRKGRGERRKRREAKRCLILCLLLLLLSHVMVQIRGERKRPRA